MTAECVHGDDPTICPPCQGPPRRAPRVRAWSGSFAAAFPGVCDTCDDPIDPGDLIRRVGFTDGTSAYRHAEPACNPELL